MPPRRAAEDRLSAPLDGARLYDDVKARLVRAGVGADTPLSLVPFLGPYFVRRCSDLGILTPRGLLRFFESRVVPGEAAEAQRSAVARVASSLSQNRRANVCVPHGRGSSSYWVADVNARAYCALLAAADIAAASPRRAGALALGPGRFREVVRTFAPRARTPPTARGAHPAAGCACRGTKALCEARADPVWEGACVWAGGMCLPADESLPSPMPVAGTSGQSLRLPWPAVLERRGTYVLLRRGSRVAWRRPGRLPEAPIPPESAWLHAGGGHGAAPVPAGAAVAAP
jgi:hypothetical protein